MRAQGTPASTLSVVVDALEPVQRAVQADHHAADAAVAHQQVAAEADPGHGNLGRQRAQEGGEVGQVARHEPGVGRAAGVPGRVPRHRLVAPHPGLEAWPAARALMRAPPGRAGRQLARDGADAAGAHGHHEVAVLEHGGERPGSSCTDSTNTGSTRPRERTARHSARPSALAIGASPAA
jgi:hypothetical protein